MSYGKVNKTTGERIPYAGNGSAGIDTTYTLSVGTGADADKIVLTPSSGTADKITVPYATNAGTVDSKMAGNAIAYFESSTPNTEINITGAGHVVENTVKAENNTDLYMIRFTADAEATQTARTFNYAQNYPVLIVRRDLPINYSDGSDFTRAIHAGDYIIIKLVYDSNIMTGGVIVADHDSTIRDDFKDVIGWDNHKNLLPLTLSSIIKTNGGDWSGNSVLIHGITYTINENDDGSISSITATGTASANSRLTLLYNVDNIYGGMILSCLSQSGSSDTFRACLQQVNSPYTELASDTGNGSYIGTNVSKKIQLWIQIKSGYEIPSGGLTFYPMIRNASENSDYEPYHPVLGPAVEDHESRIEAVESGLIDVNSNLTSIDTELNSNRKRYNGGTAWPGNTLEFNLSHGNDFVYHFVAIQGSGSATTSESGYIIVHNDDIVSIYDKIGTFTASYNGTTNKLTITLPSSKYWDYRFEQVATRLG